MVYKNSEYIIIGGGVLGLAIGWKLADLGKSVILLEKDDISCGASGGNLGQISLADRWEAWHIGLSLKSLEVYNELKDKYGLDYNETGGVIALINDEQMAAAETATKSLSDYGLEAQILTGERINDIEPEFDKTSAQGILYCKREGKLEPLDTCCLFRELALEKGLKIFRNTEVTGFLVQSGQIKTVYTTKGKFTGDVVINAAGSWCNEICKMAGIGETALRYHLGTAFVSQPMPKVINCHLSGGGFLLPEVRNDTSENSMFIGFCVNQMSNGSVIIGQATENKPLDKKEVQSKALTLTAKRFLRHFPTLNGIEIIRTWSAMTPYTLDGLPVFGFSDKVSNLFICAGFKGAFTVAPAVAESAVYALSGKSPEGFHIFSPNRVV